MILKNRFNMEEVAHRKKFFLGVIQVLVLVVGIGIISCVVFAAKPEHKSLDVTIEDFAKCLKETGVVMYGSDSCAFCKAQKEMFGSAFSGLRYVNCDFQSEQCAAEKVSGFPTWVFKNQQYRGVQTFDQLATLSGCQTPKII